MRSADLPNHNTLTESQLLEILSVWFDGESYQSEAAIIRRELSTSDVARDRLVRYQIVRTVLQKSASQRARS